MTSIKRMANKICGTKKNKTPKEKLILNTHKFSRKNKINIIYKKIDFLKVKINRELQQIQEIEKTLLTPYTGLDIAKIEKIDLIYNKKIIFEKFFIVYAGLVFGGQKKLYDIYDFEKNKIGQIVLKNLVIQKSNNNIIDSFEFSGLFFKCYDDYLNKFIKFLDINKNEQNLIKRIDYCIDLKGLEVFEYLPYIKEIYRKTKNINGLTATDIKELSKNTSNIKYGRQEVYINYFSEHNDLKIYDKILRVLDEIVKKKKRVNGKNPYQSYVDSKFPIIRLELKKKKFKNLKNNSINWVFQNIEALFFDYLLRYFTIDFSLYIGEKVTLNGKKIFLAEERKQKNLHHSYIMAQSFLRNIEDIVGKEGVYKFLYKIYPDLENVKPLNLASELDISDFFAGISEDIINLDYK